MSGFGAETSSLVSEAAKTQDLKQSAANEARKQAAQSEPSHGLQTPEATPGPDAARLEADKARRRAEPAEEVLETANVEKSKAKNAGDKIDKAQSQGAISPVPSSAQGDSEGGQQPSTEEQQKAVNRVLKCGAKEYHKILGVKDPSPKEDIQTAFDQLSILLDPSKNHCKGAEDAFRCKPSFSLSQTPPTLRIVLPFDARLTSPFSYHHRRSSSQW